MKGSIYNRLYIPKPCHEDWSKMTPDEKGAFCKSCNKSVYDFTNKNAEEVESILVAAKGHGEVCGRFNNDQLAPVPELEIPLHALNQVPGRLSPFRAFALAVFVVFGTALFGCVDAYGQKMGKVKLVTVEKPEPEAEIDKTIRGEIAYIPEDTVKPACKLPEMGEVQQLMGDTVILPEEINMKGQVVVMPEPYPLMGGVSFINIDVPPVSDAVAVMMIDTIIPAVTEPVSEVTETIEMMSLGMVVMITPQVEHPPVMPEIPVVDDKPITGEEIIVIDDNALPVKDEEETEAPNEDWLVTGGGSKPSINCYPNPSIGPVMLNYEIKKQTDVRMELFDLQGKKVKTLVDIKGCYNGIYNTSFDLSDLDAGIYICTMQTGAEMSSTRIVITK